MASRSGERSRKMIGQDKRSLARSVAAGSQVIPQPKSRRLEETNESVTGICEAERVVISIFIPPACGEYFVNRCDSIAVKNKLILPRCKLQKPDNLPHSL